MERGCPHSSLAVRKPSTCSRLKRCRPAQAIRLRSPFVALFGGPMTESSQKPVPLHPFVAKALLERRKQATYTKPDDWIFASRRHRGLTP